jgi:hypothetical protein
MGQVPIFAAKGRCDPMGYAACDSQPKLLSVILTPRCYKKAYQGGQTAGLDWSSCKGSGPH